MGVAEQKRLDLLFEMENIKMVMMPFISPGVTMKAVTELGFKDKDGNKKRFYEETRYPSEKYKNVNHLVSANFRLNTYIVIEYPNEQYKAGQSSIKTKGILIRAFAIDSLVKAMMDFTENIYSRFTVRGNEIVVLSDKAKSIEVYTSSQSSFIFSDDVYTNRQSNTQEIGVRITINHDYTFVVSAETTWAEMVYRLSRCDLTSLGVQMIQSYMALLPGMATSTLGSKYNGSSGYRPYWGEDPDDIINREGAVQVRGKPLSRQDKINDFFDNI